MAEKPTYEELKQRVKELEQGVREHKRAEGNLRETRDYLENLFNYANAPIIVWNPESRIVRFNHAFEYLTGYKDEEVIGRKLSMLFPEASLNESLKKIQRTLSGEYWESVEVPILCKNEDIRVALWNSANIYAEDGTTLLSTIARGTDITMRKQAEEALRESEERFRTIFENAPIGIDLVNKEGRPLHVNPAFQQMFGYSEDELQSMTFPDYTHPDDVEDSWKLVRSLLDGKNDHFDVEKRYYRKDDRLWWGHTVVSAVRDVNGAVQYFIVMIQDITDRKEAEKKIERSLREKELLLREIHHRVKNNLQVICSLLDMRIMRTENQEMIGCLEDVCSKIHTMALIHDQLYENKQLDRIDMGRHAGELLDHISKVYERKSCFVTPVIEAANVFFSITQAIPFAMVLSELISNAYKHAFVGREAGTLWISLKNRPDDMIHIRVKDDGVGMPDEADFEETTTLGLKLVRSIVRDQLMGTIRVNGEQGTEIVIEFKLLKMENEGAQNIGSR